MHEGTSFGIGFHVHDDESRDVDQGRQHQNDGFGCPVPDHRKQEQDRDQDIRDDAAARTGNTFTVPEVHQDDEDVNADHDILDDVKNRIIKLDL